MEMSAYNHAPSALLPVHTEQEAKWTPGPFWTFQRTENVFLFSEIEPWFLGRPVRNQLLRYPVSRYI